MNPQPQPKITQSYIIDPKGSKYKVTHLQEDIDSTHVVIESTTPASSSRNQTNRPNSKDKTKYYIQIDDDDDSNIDVVVNVGQSPLIRSNRRFQTTANQIKKDEDIASRYSNSSRIRIESNPNDDYQYEISYQSQNQNNGNNKSTTLDLDRNYQTCITETHHTIKIKNNNSRSPMYYHQHPVYPNRETYQMPKQREEKTFGIHTSEVRGRIIKNGESQKNIRESEKDPAPEAGKSINQTKIIETPNKKKSEGNPIKIQDDSRMQKIQLLSNEDQMGNNQKKGLDETQKNKNLANTREPKTPKNNHHENTSDQSLSPIVQEYGNNYEFHEMTEHPYIQNIFQNRDEKNMPSAVEKKESARQESPDKQRVPPVPYSKKTTLQKQIERQISNQWPPSIKDIPIQNGKLVKKNSRESNASRGFNDSPIRVPIQKLPQNSEKKYNIESGLASASQQIKKVKIFLNSKPHQGHIHKQITHPNQKNDLFVINKQKYLEKLRRSERSKSRLENSRTFSRSSRHSLSPECQRITNRLYKTRTNEQPCPKYIHYKQLMKRSEMKEALGEYSFIRRYLTDNEIEQILTQFDLQGVPEKKWPMRLVDIVYDRLRAMKVY